MLKSGEELMTEYTRLQNACKERIVSIEKKITLFSILRGLVFLIEIPLYVAFVSVASTWQYVVALLIFLLILVFVVLVKRQGKLERKLLFEKNLLWVVENEQSVLLNGINGYSIGQEFYDDGHPYTSDLDIFGTHSLFSMLNRATTQTGLEELSNWLKVPANKEVIYERQAAAAELALVTQETFHFRAFLKASKMGALESIVQKIEKKLPHEIRFTQNKLLRIYTSLAPFLSLGLLVAFILSTSFFGYALLINVILNLIIVYVFSKKVQTIHNGFSGFADNLEDFASAIAWTENGKWTSKYLHKLFEGDVQNSNVSDQIKALARIIGKFDARLNMVANVFLNGLFVWDLRCSILLEKWFNRSSSSIINGLLRLPKFEAILSLGTLRYNHADWSFPEISDEFAIQVSALAHPLIPISVVVKNDYHMKNKLVDIVTGSNMAGKSTFLRSIGVNMVLAYCGAPVAANSMKVSIMRILTYMRIKDALDTNTSTFKAELNRLKLILSEVGKDKNSLVLIDEMLRGTNSGDKYEGSKAFIQRMVDLQIPTLFATHDLQLSEMENDRGDKIKNHHFDIFISATDMKFDYKLKEGPCNVFNAAVLLKEIGL